MLYSNRHASDAALTEGDTMTIAWVMLLVLWISIIVFAVGAVAFIFRSSGR